MTPKRSKKQSRYHGILAVDKPSGLTSQGVVDVIRRVAATRRVGHSGTLDPLATGLLIVLLGEATKLSEYLVGFDKTYEGTMRLGVQSDTYDSQGNVESGPGGAVPETARLQELAAEFTGTILQTPPPYSAVKVRGRKLYEYARAGEKVEAKPREVRVDSFDILGNGDGELRFRIACSSGTYVRSLVHELGQKTGCGALVSSLRRTRVGDFDLSEAVTLDKLEADGHDGMEEHVLPMVDGLTSWPLFYLNAGAEEWIHRGQAIPAPMVELDAESPSAKVDDLCFLCPPGKDAVAVAKYIPAPPSRPPASLARLNGPWLQPVKLLSVSSD
ncbi:tRNA pseudouridine(55) synthase TruB [bacterium]|nr:tRNA pseudouridine(55) synthase TruB [bacterium]